MRTTPEADAAHRIDDLQTSVAHFLANPSRFPRSRLRVSPRDGARRPRRWRAAMDGVEVFSPAKINFMLAITGRRSDGFHDLVSVVAPLDFGDTVRVGLRPERDTISLTCSDASLPAGPDNLAWRAAELFRRTTGIRTGIELHLEKVIPVGAGLGGGSSNAVAVLQALNQLCHSPLDGTALQRLAAELGSDCSLFFAGTACAMRGRGEQIEPLAAAVTARLSAARLLLFKPDFGVSTAWAYGQLAAKPDHYLASDAAEARLTRWLHSDADPAALLFNSFEPVVFRKFRALPAVQSRLRASPGVRGVLMSGSGSACFAVITPDADVPALCAMLHDTLGAHAFVREVRVRGTPLTGSARRH